MGQVGIIFHLTVRRSRPPLVAAELRALDKKSDV